MKFPAAPWAKSGSLALCLVLLGCALLGTGSLYAPGPSRVQAATATGPDEVCQGCHSSIYATYKQTAMARGSGTALAGFLEGGFTDSSSGVRYRVFQRDGRVWMSYARSATSPRGELAGEHEVEYYVGSGHRGRTFLYRQQGLWFELPVNYYTRRAAWDMAPNYNGLTAMPAPLPVDANCLHCHSSGTAQSDGTARNALGSAPFAQGGISCAACHGDPSQHLAASGHGPIVNPGKLPSERRDSACIQCHLEGDATVYRAGRSLAEFQPGDRLSDIALYFVRASQAGGGARASSQYEALLQSACKRASGDRLTCTTCHDPHSDPAPAERVAFYRARCLACHTAPALATAHHPEQQDCAACHMPSRSTADISHEQVTDHNIERRPSGQERSVPSGNLVPAGGFTASDRDLGLAYAQMAQRGDQAAGHRAFDLLTKAEHDGGFDEQLALNLGFLYQVSGSPAQAKVEYERALQVNPHEPAALSNLAVLQAGTGHITEAIALLQTLVGADPSQTAAGINLARLQCGTGQGNAAQGTVKRLQDLNPDAPAVRLFMRQGCRAFGAQ